MDPISQAAFGSLWSLAGSRGKKIRAAAVAGALAGMAPDLDVLIRSPNDALLFIDYHRHFTHAIPFAPVGALIVAAALWPLMRKHLGFAQLYLFCFLGYLSHGILDAFTSYGTYLSWPFSNDRAALNWISVIDPLFTLPLLLLLGISIWRKAYAFSLSASVWALMYLAFGGWQHHRAEQAVEQWAQNQNIQALRLVAKPSFANLILWRGLIDDGEHFHSIALRLPPFGDTTVFAGEQVSSLQSQEVAPKDSRLARDMQRFDYFSDGWVFRYAPLESKDEWFVGDFRYAIDPASARPLWGIRFSPSESKKGVVFERLREVNAQERERFIRRLLGPLP
jgi:inner membrane protein